jgi:hypothetical protein
MLPELDRIKELEAAIDWCLENGAIYSPYRDCVDDSGCGCCANTIETTKLPQPVIEAMRRLRPTEAGNPDAD